MLPRNMNVSVLNRTRRLQAFTAGLSQSLTPEQIGEMFAHEGIAATGASAGSVFMITADRMLQRIGTAGYDPNIARGWGYFSLDVSSPVTDCIRLGVPIWLTSAEEWRERYPDVPMSSSDDRAWASIPLMVHSQAIGCINLTFRTFVPDDADKTFFVDLAFQCAQALSRAQVYAAERRAHLDAETERAHLNTILDTISDGFITLDRDWRCTYINRCAAQILRCTRQGLLGQILWDIFPHPPYICFDILHEAVDQRCEMDTEQYDLMLDRWLHLRVYPTADGVTLYLQDITARKQEEHARQISETRFNHFMNANVIGIIVANDAGDITDANDNFLQIVGYTRADLDAGRIRWKDMTPPEYVVVDDRATEEAQRTGKAANYEKEYFRKDGSRVPILVGGVLNDHIWTAFVIDLSEPKRIENEQRFLSEASVTLTASLDYAETLENTNGLIVPALADALLIYVVQPDNSLQRLTLKNSMQTITAVLDQNAPGMEDVSGVGRVIRTGQAERYASIPAAALNAAVDDERYPNSLQAAGVQSAIIVPLPARGRILGALLLMRVQSGHRYMPSDLALAEEVACRVAITLDNAHLYQQAQAALAERNEFLSVAAHELKTPVTSLHGFVQLLLRQIDKRRTVEADQLETALRVIDKQSRKLTQLMAELLDVARLEAARFTLEKQPIDLTLLVNDVVTTLQFGVQQSHTIYVSAPPSLPILADPIRLEQVLINLLDNAIKYSPDGGTIDMMLTTMPSESGEAEASLSVTDHGLGIPEARRLELFSRFYQAHGTGYLSGMGLGLYVSRQIIELHGGQITAEFPAEGGTRFVIRLPIEQRELWPMQRSNNKSH